MATKAVKEATKGFFAILAAAFLLLAGFVLVIMAVLTPSPPRMIGAATLLAAGFLFLRGGTLALRRASGKEPEEPLDEGHPHDATAGRRSTDDPTDDRSGP